MFISNFCLTSLSLFLSPYSQYGFFILRFFLKNITPSKRSERSRYTWFVCEIDFPGQTSCISFRWILIAEFSCFVTGAAGERSKCNSLWLVVPGAGVKMEHFQATLDLRKQELLEARFLGARVSLPTCSRDKVPEYEDSS